MRDDDGPHVEEDSFKHYHPTQRQSSWHTGNVLPTPNLPRPIQSASDNPAARGMHTEATNKRKDFRLLVPS